MRRHRTCSNAHGGCQASEANHVVRKSSPAFVLDVMVIGNRLLPETHLTDDHLVHNPCSTYFTLHGSSLGRARIANRPTQRGRSRGNTLILFSGRLPSGLGTRVQQHMNRSVNEPHQQKASYCLASSLARLVPSNRASRNIRCTLSVGRLTK